MEKQETGETNGFYIKEETYQVGFGYICINSNNGLIFKFGKGYSTLEDILSIFKSI